jgi:glutathione S-transferase
MICVHHLNNSRSHRVLWLLEELGLEYDVKCYERDPRTMLAPAELRAVHPLGKSPIITDGDVTMAESGAILEYIVGRYGDGRLIPRAPSPDNSLDRCGYRALAAVGEGSEREGIWEGWPQDDRDFGRASAARGLPRGAGTDAELVTENAPLR